jgi:hypothetical protein
MRRDDNLLRSDRGLFRKGEDQLRKYEGQPGRNKGHGRYLQRKIGQNEHSRFKDYLRKFGDRSRALGSP